MYWHQKAAMVCDTQAHLDSLTNSVSSWLSGKTMKWPPTIEQSGTQGRGAACIIVADYVNQADADQAWTFVKNAQSNAWVIAPSFAVYSAMNDDGTVSAITERINW